MTTLLKAVGRQIDVWCDDCQHAWHAEPMAVTVCPRCGSSEIRSNYVTEEYLAQRREAEDKRLEEGRRFIHAPWPSAVTTSGNESTPSNIWPKFTRTKFVERLRKYAGLADETIASYTCRVERRTDRRSVIVESLDGMKHVLEDCTRRQLFTPLQPGMIIRVKNLRREYSKSDRRFVSSLRTPDSSVEILAVGRLADMQWSAMLDRFNQLALSPEASLQLLTGAAKSS